MEAFEEAEAIYEGPAKHAGPRCEEGGRACVSKVEAMIDPSEDVLPAEVE